MSVTSLAGGRKATRFLILLAAAACLAALGVLDAALAQGNPFGGPRPPAAPPPSADGFVGWLLLKQAEFYQKLAGTIRSAKTDGSAVWLLMGISFAYGIFHAAGPGHGKAVISSYLVANEETWKRGITLSFASAFVQALVAVLVVGIAAALLNATARTMNSAVWWIEIVSYLLIAAMGARLLWTKGRAFWNEWQFLRAPKTLGAAATVSHAHHHHGHDHHHHHGHDHHHADPAHGEPGHVHDEHCGHAHGPTPDQLSGPGGWKRGLMAIFAVGLRPCSGAILVLVFALAQGIFWAGIAATFVMGLGTAITVAAIATLTVTATAFAARIAATRTGYGSLALRAMEAGAAAVVLLFGVALLAGYMTTERMVGL
ncbi:MAG: nickel/cobalt transporter (NicO) family protein [Hyphomicrobiales bacterium]|jgi:ABC-type nickel/cobalt efflux system permease component RcnA|nr:nickel/cobalt transporter (NicO) family protein [Hyphomicrobiales bacterium]